MEKTDAQLASLIEKLQEAGFGSAPEVIEGAIRAIQWDGTVQLWTVAAFGAVLVLSFIGIIISFVKDWEGFGGATIAAFIGSFILGLIAATTGNPWLKVFDPKAALYQRIIEGIF